MNIKKISCSILTGLFIFQSIHCTNIDTLSLITAQADEIAQAIKPHTIKLLATKALDTGLANIPLANLKELLAHEQLAAKIISRMNYINDITRENVHLFIQPIADNFDHVNQHTLDWILYLRPDDTEPIVPIFVKNFKTMLEKDNGRKLILKILEYYPDIQEKHFSAIKTEKELILLSHIMKLTTATEWDDQYQAYMKIIEFIKAYPPSIFMQCIINNFVAFIERGYLGEEILSKIIALHPETGPQLAQTAIDNISILANDYYGKELLTKLIEYDPQVQKALDNDHFKSKVKDGLKAMGIITVTSAVGSLLLCSALKFIVVPIIKDLRLARLKDMASKMTWPDIPGLKPLGVLWTLYNKKQ